MNTPMRDRLAFWLENTPLRRWILRYDGAAPAGVRYVNRMNGHVVVEVGE